MIDIELLYVEDCPNYTRACAIICDVIKQEGLDVTISIIKVTDANRYKYPNFKGSPSVLVNNVDVEDCLEKIQQTEIISNIACRIYDCTIHRGCPSHDMIKCAIQTA